MVSIPLGTINTHLSPQVLQADNDVSIPLGTINTTYGITSTLLKLVSIPLGTINTIFGKLQ